MRLGIFDSGIGGEAIANSLSVYFPDAEIITVNDRKNLPYGDKTDVEINNLTDQAIQPLLLANCDAIVIACNTATAITIDRLRSKYPEQKFIGIEPMIKTAAGLTKSNVITVCATPATLRSKRYNDLKIEFGKNIKIFEPDCSDWAQLIENNNINDSHIETIIDRGYDLGSDVIVLACTHYHWIKETITRLAKNHAIVIEPSDAMGRQIERLLNNS